MRFQNVVATTALLAAIVVDSTGAFAQFNYRSQNRSISAYAKAYPNFQGVLFFDDAESVMAPDFTDFVDSRSASAGFGGSLISMANASQASQLMPTTISALGEVSDHGFRGLPTVGEATGDSIFSTTFSVEAPIDIQIAVNLFANHGTIAPLSSISGTTAFSLTGGAINPSQATSFSIGSMDSSAQLLQALSLPSGTYTVTASAHSDSGIPDFQTTVGNFLDSNASYSVSIRIVPEPSSLTLLVTGAVILLWRTARRHRNRPARVLPHAAAGRVWSRIEGRTCKWRRMVGLFVD